MTAIASTNEVTTRGDVGQKLMAVLRISTGFVFLWAFLDKAFGLGYSTPSAKAWINGGSPTKGFLSNVEVGPFQGMFQSMAGAWWANLLFMVGLAAVGTAVILGMGMWISAVSGSIIMFMMWLAEWPMATVTSAGEPSGSSNPFMDYHIIYGIVLFVLAVHKNGETWGLGKFWAGLPVVRDNAWLR
ncbi:hypothetical protein [Actinosynnema pretiosum]|uniref:Integral membrane protein SCJ12.13c n=1 Tax=Actinosynnema pretiosum TaxID=42197 RepID=A0A290Z4W0_9PSEU|nr:hypothetical protein CNX65_12770 [Actinosynnema pretiosum]